MIMLIGILKGDALLDINVYDTYYLIGYLHLATLISILFGIIGMVYWIMQKANRKLSKWLNLTHIGLTIGGTLIVWILSKFYRIEITEHEFNNNLTLIITSIILFMIVGQLLFPINIIFGLVNRKNKSSV